MKKLKSFFIITTMFLLYTNNSYATTTGRYTIKEDSGGIKFLFLLFAIAMVAAVLYLSYRFDKKDAVQKRKEKIEKYKTKEKMQQVYDEKQLEENIIKSYKNNIIEKDIKVNPVEKKKILKFEQDNIEENMLEKLKQDITDVQIPEKVEMPKKIIIPEEIDDEENIILSNSASDSTMVINTNDIKKMTQEENEENYDYKEELIEEKEEQTVKEEVVEDDDYQEDEDYEEDEELDYENEELSKIGKMFTNKVKGYDYEEEDFELNDLKETIAAANIKKYKKVGETIRPIIVNNQEEIRKKSMLIENKKAKKRYTRKK